MKIICWNVRGLGKPRTVNRLRNALRGSQPPILFLMETKLHARKMEKVRRRCGYPFGFDVSAEGTRGGLSLGWRPEVDITLRNYSQSHIDVTVDEGEDIRWRFTGFYGNLVESQRHASWRLLRELGNNQTLPWIVAGDFNEIAYSFEKQGGRLRPERNMVGFRDALEDCHLTDLGFKGTWYTWERGKLQTNNVRERLDRMVANPSWWQLFPRYMVSHLPHSISDHCPLLLDTSGADRHLSKDTHNEFRFEAIWLMEDGVEEIITHSWNASTEPLPKRLKDLGCTLATWWKNKKRMSSSHKRSLQKKL
ncbi:hypothetical protein HRI_000460700 [Hibiscus trionum]|uniref:Endonuclease/exonuclease/phosphatase domain-containing protein n=1 Tax=Hibiscus trionum TaxID=183268 RepID=A0A9W7GYL0_HIBTR|nr:hypothetical protein HRI_000460700 [Hibiscus trionum]